ncbi:MAG: shikimate dehydrogenase [Planctomycetaceae bacterium]|nr:shikimate dehydrogenase [Planctomycetaceae bacterium]
MICVSIGRTRHKMVVAEHRALADRGAELVELRLDWLSRQPDLGRLLGDRPTPCVVTCRRRSDRGRWAGTENQRLALLRAAIVAGAEYVDLEDDIAGGIPRYGSTKRIVSHHNFDETPENLEEIHSQLTQYDPDLVKLVTMANSPGDMVRMLRLVESASVPTIGFCMGELGVPSRILCGKFGSPFTYATFSGERELAPGQIPFEVMRDVYRYDQIGPETCVFGVLGDPIAHSLSPLIHNAAFASLGMDSVYLPLRVPRNQLETTLRDFEWLGIDGYSVTIPHKQGVLEFAGQKEEMATRIGAANTLVRQGDGQWLASNTDYQAALEALQEALRTMPGGSDDLAGRKVLLLGSGGAARAIAMAMVQRQAAVTIASRTHSHAVKLSEELGCQQIQWENRGTVFSEILINCTPVGMHPEVDETPFAENWLREGMVVFDTVYNPENTLLLKQARERSCVTVSGIEMFVRQAALQFERFTGQEPPEELMRDTVRRGISAVRR